MKFEQVEKLNGEKFKRLTGVQRRTFDRALEILNEAEKKQKELGGRKNKLRMEDRLLLMLEYLREYRTYFHIGQSYGVSESTAFKTIRWIEDTLVEHPDFRLPGKEALQDGKNYTIVLIDATESPIERPKKNRKDTILERKSATR